VKYFHPGWTLPGDVTEEKDLMIEDLIKGDGSAYNSNYKNI